MKQTIEYGIIGLGRFGMALAMALANNGKEVLVIDNNESKIKDIRDFVEEALVVEHLTKESLVEAGIQNCKTVIVCIGQQIDKSILVTLNVISMGVPRVIAKAISEDQGFVLKKIGAEVVYPEKDMACRLANRLLYSTLSDFIELDENIAIFEVIVTEILIGKKILEASLRQQYHLNIIAVRHDHETTVEFTPDYVFQTGDKLYVVGKKSDIKRFETYLGY